ncbi:hypothetical protein Q7P37_004534 [Cladosporium fusiforme]
MESATGSRRFPCDACRRRKVRCDYARPCDRCQSYNLVCTYDSVRKKRGPKKGKGAVVEQLRAESRGVRSQSDSPAATDRSPSRQNWQDGTEYSLDGYMGPSPATAITSPAVPDALTNVAGPAEISDDNYLTFDEFAHIILGSSGPEDLNANRDETYTNSSPAQLHNLLSSIDSNTPIPIQNPFFEINAITERGVSLFFSHLYPIYPILDENEIRTALLAPSEMPQATACMLLAMCAMSLVHVERWPHMSNEQRAVHARKYIRRCQQIRMHSNFIEEATFEDILCSLFIAVTYFELKCRKASWFYVREAITLAHATSLHLVSRDLALSDTERLRKQRTYALLFITERGAAVLDNFPVTILSPPPLPGEPIPGEDPAIILGLNGLHHLFSLLDFDFVHLWNNLASLSSADSGLPELSRLQEHLRQNLNIHGISDIQRADVLITQQWLRLVFWQAALRLGLISSSAEDSALTYHYPITIASSLCEIVKSLPPVAIQVHGLGIFEKQFEIAYSLLDALTLSGATQPADHYETLRYLLLSLSASPNSRQIYVRTLEKKMGGGPEGNSEQKYRHIAGVQLLRDDGSIRQLSRRASVVNT